MCCGPGACKELDTIEQLSDSNRQCIVTLAGEYKLESSICYCKAAAVGFSVFKCLILVSLVF